MRDGRGYEREYRGNDMPKRTKDKPGGIKKRSELFLLIACLLLAMNILLLLKLQAQVKGMNRALNQALSRLAVSQQEQDYVIPQQEEWEDEEDDDKDDEEVAINPSSSLENTGQEEEVDYVSLCGLPEVDKPVKRTKAQVLERLQELAEDSDDIADIYKNHTLYSDDMLKALANNPEMADFVKNYLTADTRSIGAEFTEAEKEQDFPLFLQWDPRWGYVEYGENNMGLSGCGPTCVSMALYYLLRDETITPEKIASYSTKNGYYVVGAGTAWTLLVDAPAQYGVKVTQPRASEKTLKAALDDGKIVICSMKAGDFTDGGHFVVIYGYDSDGFLINDSNCVARSREKWPYERIRRQIKHTWVYSVPT